MKLRKTIVLWSLFLIIAIVAGAQAQAEMCVPSYIDTEGVSGTYSSLSHPQDGQCPPAHVNVEGSINDKEDRNESMQTSCCCRCFGNDNFEVISFEAPTGYEHLVSTTYCTEKNYEAGQPDETNCTAACSDTCSGTGGPLIEETDLYHEITGYVHINGTTASNVSVFALDQGDDVIVEAITDADGYYNLGAVPGVKNGKNTFLAMTESQHEYDCADNYQEITLTDDRQLNFTMQQCTRNAEYCKPDWQTSEWGECKPYFGQSFQGQYVQTRTVTDANNCNITSNKPKTWKLCEGNATIANCGNGELEQGEFCDPATQDGAGDAIFSLPNGENASSVSCNDILGQGYSDETTVSCTDSCTYDYSDCQPVCGMYFDRIEECSMEECQSLCHGEPLCGNECEGEQPQFLPTNSSGLDVFSTRNVYDLYEPGILEPNHHPGIRYFDESKDVELSWSFNGTCEDEILAYQLVYCEEDDNSRTCKGDTRQRVEVPQGTYTHKMSDVLEPDTSFCYNVCAITTDGETNCAYDEKEKLPCFNTGKEYCMESHSQGYDCKETSSGDIRPTGCSFKEFKSSGSGTFRMTNHSYEISDEDCTGKTCVETPYDPLNNDYGATCKEPIECSTCNGPFGVYGASDNMITYTNENNQSRQMQCDRFLDPTQDNFANTQWAGLCYYDMSLSSINYYDTCSKVGTCYDYSSEQACENDPCNSMDDGCQWSSHSEELGVGVCKPVKQELQECVRCDSESPLGFCTEQLCENNYGDCYYREPSDNTVESEEKTVLSDIQGITTQDDRYSRDETVPTCIDQDKMACGMYQTEQDCVGNGTGIEVDVTYENDKAIYGTNEILTTSQDRFGYGGCTWVENASKKANNGCHKNTDGLFDDGMVGDCYSSSYFDELKCWQDTTPPNTTLILREPPENEMYKDLPTYGINEIANITFKVEDETWAADEPDTYFTMLSKEDCPSECYNFTCTHPDNHTCIQQAKACENSGCSVYPDTLQRDMAKEEYKNESMTDGIHKLKFFSQDPAKNLETVKSTELFIDGVAPEIYHEPDDLNITSFKLNDIYRSNVSIEFSTSEEAMCSYHLEYQSIGEGLKIYGKEYQRLGTQFAVDYRFVPDNQYDFVITCEDEYKNVNERTIPVRVEGDVSISNTKPRMEVFAGDEIDQIELSLDTIDEATCRFDPERNTFDDARYDFTASNQGLSHSRMFSDFTDTNTTSQSLEGLYSYYTACDYTNRTITEGLHSDMISFSIDTTGPETTLYYLKDDEYIPFKESGDNATPRASERLIRIECDDSDDGLPGSTFGCKEIRYCYSNTSILDLSTFDPNSLCNDGAFKTSGSRTHFEDTLEYQTDQDVKIYYYGVDQGGNTGELHRMNLKVTDTNFTRPVFRIT